MMSYKHVNIVFGTLTFIVLLIFFSFVSPLFAQDTLKTYIPLPELIELNYDNIELQNWQIPADTLQTWHGINFSQAEARMNWLPRTNQMTNRLLLSTSPTEYENYPQLQSIIYQKLRRGETPVNRLQAGLLYNHSPSHLSIMIGNFRLQAGEGLCLGSYQAANHTKQKILYPATGLSHPALTGFAANLNLFRSELAFWLSDTQRQAKLNNGKIINLYESSLVDISNKEHVSERTSGIIASHSIQKQTIGAYYYHHSLNYGYSDYLLQPVNQIYGIFGDIKFKSLKLGLETNLANDRFAKAIRIDNYQSNFNQSFHYIYRPSSYSLPYAKTEQIFGQNTGSEELSWDIRYKQTPNLTLISRIAMVKDLSSEATTHWKERLILSADWHNKYRQTGLTYYRFRKDAVAVYDTLYTDILPIQNRIKGYWKQDIVNNLNYSISCQYQHYQDKKLSKNGISTSQTFSYDFKKLKIAFSFLNWSNQKNVYQSSELMDNVDYLAQSDTDSAFKLNFKYLLFNKCRVNFQSYIPVKHTDTQSYICSISTSF